MPLGGERSRLEPSVGAVRERIRDEIAREAQCWAETVWSTLGGVQCAGERRVRGAIQ